MGKLGYLIVNMVQNREASSQHQDTQQGVKGSRRGLFTGIRKIHRENTQPDAPQVAKSMPDLKLVPEIPNVPEVLEEPGAWRSLGRRRVTRRGAIAGAGAAALGVAAVAYVGTRGGGEGNGNNQAVSVPTGGSSSQEASNAVTSPTPDQTAPSNAVSGDKPSVAPEPEKQTEAPLNDIIFNFADNVSQVDRNIIQDSAFSAREFYRREMGLNANKTVFYNVINNPTDTTTTRGGTGFTDSGGSVTVNVGISGWTRAPLIFKQRIPSHEYFHAVTQDVWSRVSMGPFWVIEGTADYAGYATLIDKGITSLEDVRKLQFSLLKSEPKQPQIDAPSMNSYRLAYLAVEVLLGDRGIGIIGDYVRNLGAIKNISRESWKQAFEITFGETPEAFVARFEDWRTKNI